MPTLAITRIPAKRSSPRRMPLHEPVFQGCTFERRPGEEVEVSKDGVVEPGRLYYYAKQGRSKNVKHGDDTAKTYLKEHPIVATSDSLELNPGSLPLSIAYSSTSEIDNVDTAASPLLLQTIARTSSPHPEETTVLSGAAPSVHTDITIPAEFAPLHMPSHAQDAPVASIRHTTVSTLAAASETLEDVHVLAHLANGQADAWFHLRIGAHRHDDDVDHEAEEHAIAEEIKLLAHEVNAALHTHTHTLLHHDFAAWWGGWHTHEAEAADAEEEHLQEAARSAEEKVDGVDHEAHSWIGSLGVHTAENFWGWAEEQHLTIETIHGLDDLPDVLHAEHFHGSVDMAHGIGGTDAEMEEYDGFRHQFVAQVEIGWQYKSHRLTVISLTGEKIEVGASASYDVPMSDWYKMALDISPYTPPIDVVASLMAGHEVPPVE